MAIIQLAMTSVGLPRPQTNAIGRRCPLGQYLTASVTDRRGATRATPVHIVYFPVSPDLAPLPSPSRGVEM